mgnify:CR=1 FL=1
MIKIVYKEDLKSLKNKGLNPLITAYLTDYFDMLTMVNHCHNLAEIGAIYLLESTQDCKNHSEIGLSKPIEKSLPEFSELITIKNSTDKIKLLHSCFVISNSCAISVFAKIGSIDKSIENYLLQEHTTQTIELNSERL